MTGSEASSNKGSITRVFLDFPVEPGDTFELLPGENHHIRNVLRGRTGDSFEAVDARRHLFTATLRERSRAVIVDEKSLPDVPDDGITLFQALPKGRNMDLVVEKATELGVKRIVPLVTERVVSGSGENKVDRWRRLAEAAARQSLQLRVPRVEEPIPLSEALNGRGDRVLLHNGEDLPALEVLITELPTNLYVGPEGGWSDRELEMAREAGLVFAGLGPYRLRSETAGIVAVARAQAAVEGSNRKTEII